MSESNSNHNTNIDVYANKFKSQDVIDGVDVDNVDVNKKRPIVVTIVDRLFIAAVCVLIVVVVGVVLSVFTPDSAMDAGYFRFNR